MLVAELLSSRAAGYSGRGFRLSGLVAAARIRNSGILYRQTNIISQNLIIVIAVIFQDRRHTSRYAHNATDSDS